MKILYLCIAAFCLLHIVRDVLQIKYGYKNWFLRVGHVWNSPKHEVHGMVIFAILGGFFLYLGLI